MARRKVLLTGGTGLLGTNWACALRESHEVVLGTHVRDARLAGTTSVRLDLEDAGRLADTVARIAPDVVVHTAGITSVEACEADPALAEHVYGDLSRNIAAAAAAARAQLIHISTDHLFAGAHALYSETDAPEPVNAYGRTKLLSETAAAQAHPRPLVVRTNFFGWGHRYRRSFSDWIYYNLVEGRPITMFDDVFVSPILADRLALCAHRVLDAGGTGVYNVVGDERISKYDFGVKLANAFDLPASLIQRGKIASSQLSVKRPPDMSLDNRKARALLGTSLGTIDEYLGTLRQQDLAGRRAELLGAVSE